MRRVFVLSAAEVFAFVFCVAGMKYALHLTVQESLFVLAIAATIVTTSLTLTLRGVWPTLDDTNIRNYYYWCQKRIWCNQATIIALGSIAFWLSYFCFKLNWTLTVTLL